MINIKPETFCANPWYQIRILPDSSVSYCRRGLDESHEIQSNNFLSEFVSNPFLNQARDHFSHGEPGVMKNCARCFREESQGMDSYRQEQNIISFIHPDYPAESLAQSDVLHRVHHGVTLPKNVFVKFSNRCNMTCRMCSGQSSESLNQLYKESAPERYYPEYATAWPDDPELWQSFLDITLHNDQLDILQINGGEPTSDPKFWEFLNLLVDQGKTDIKLIVTTNCAEYHPELVPLMKKFQFAVLDMSVETFTPANDYIRVPSKHTQIKKHMSLYLQGHPHENFIYMLHITPQIYSIADLYTVLDFAQSHNVSVSCEKAWPQLHLDPVILSPAYKQHLVDFYTYRYRNANASVKNAVGRLKFWLTLPEPENIAELRHKFVTETKLHDSLLGTDFSLTFPELARFFRNI